LCHNFFSLNLEFVVMKGCRSVLGIGCFDGNGFSFFFI
jgi:hypothetical protein